MPFDFQSLEIPGVKMITPRQFFDNRGYFLECYKQTEFAENGIPESFVQDNISHSNQNVLRGLHYQVHPHMQGKLIMVLQGEIFDVAADIRPESPTFRQWLSVNLSAENHRMLYIPPGFAHGFCVLSPQATVLYKCTREYVPNHETGVLWSDPAIGIKWPIQHPILSEKDRKLPLLEKV
jgi:dTDP-4-dehydrorhamnose 3,5-epimerase